MKAWIAIVLFSLLTCSGISAQRNGWKAGEFGKLTAGKSTRKEVLRVLGASTPSRGSRLETYEYPGKGDFGAEVIVEVNRATGLVETITQRFAPNITRTQARKKYGNDYREVQYSISDCPTEGANPLAYRDPKGPVGLIEYANRGLVLWPNKEGFDIAAALYLAKPFPGKKPVCTKR